MDVLIGLYQKFEPAIGVMEQVWGFTMPFDSQSAPDDTPKSRPIFAILHSPITNYLGCLFGFDESVEFRL